jgi:hypothetical protein
MMRPTQLSAVERAAEGVDDAADPTVGDGERVAGGAQLGFDLGAGAEAVGGGVGHGLGAAVAEADDFGGHEGAVAGAQVDAVADRDVVAEADDVDSEPETSATRPRRRREGTSWRRARRESDCSTRDAVMAPEVTGEA